MSAPAEFAIWLQGYADGKPDACDAVVRDKLMEVIAGLVAERLLAKQYEREMATQTFGLLSRGKQPASPAVLGRIPNLYGTPSQDEKQPGQGSDKSPQWGMLNPAHM